VKNVLAALLKAQAGFPAIPKNKINPHFKSHYAGLDIIIAVTQPILHEHGLVVYHSASQAGDQWVLTTVLMHVDSGESIICTLPLKGTDDQKLGSSMTYMRRYGYGCVCGFVSDDDDDGNASSSKPRRTRKEKDPASRAGDGKEAENAITGQLWPAAYHCGDAMGLDKEEATKWFRAKMKSVYEVESAKDLTQPQANELLMWLRTEWKKAQPPTTSTESSKSGD
jgi:hypothetical protein